MKVLIADDAKMMRTIIRRALEGLGVKDITEAEDGVQATDFFSGGKFDLVFTDWNMPNKDGLQVLQEIRAADKSVPVIMVTTEGQQSNVLQAVKAGVTDYILKPFDSETLKAKILKHSPADAVSG